MTAAEDLARFIDASPSPYHAVAEAIRRLEAAGYVPLDEREQWQVAAGTRAYVVRGGGSIVAFAAGSAPPERAGFLLIGAHTDSPNLRVKPSPDVRSQGYRQLAVEVYGGVLLSTWLDRDLSLAGRVSLRDGASALVRFDRAIARIPNLAIHLNRDVNSAGLLLNAQNHLVPVLGMAPDKNGKSINQLLSEELGRAGAGHPGPDDILGWDLCFHDLQPAAIAGIDGEFIHSARLDNLGSCHAALTALLAAGEPGESTRVVALYDHEEVGSQSAAGARSKFLTGVLERIASAWPGASSQATPRAFARSFLLSADMAHAVHPNYADKHDKEHAPRLGRGPVIKVNANQSYASDAPGIALFQRACAENGIKTQRFVSRNDMPCGSTIGPISAARMGVRTVDVGNPMLGMHSCREMAGVGDVEPMIHAMSWLLTHGKAPDPAG